MAERNDTPLFHEIILCNAHASESEVFQHAQNAQRVHRRRPNQEIGIARETGARYATA